MRKKKNTWKRGLSLLLTAGLFAGTVPVYQVQAAEADITSGLIAYYDFETVSDKKVENKVDADTFTGIISGSNVSIQDDTELGHSLRFTEGTDGCMTIGDIVNTGVHSYSISMWYKYDTSAERGNKRTVLLQQSGGGRTLLTLTSGNKYHTYVNTMDVDGERSVDINKWQQVIFVCNSETKKVQFYINGELDCEKDAGTGSVNELTDLLIGRHKNGGNDPLSMRGLVDEIRVYDKVLTAAEAKAIYEDKADVFAENDSSVTLQVDVDQTLRKIDSDSIFGINHRYAFNGYGSFDSETGRVKEEFQSLYEDAGFGSIRYPGGTISNLFNWKSTIGPVEMRKNQIHGFYDYSGQGGIAPNFGLGEIGDFADDVDSEIVYVYSLGRGNAQDAADLVEYLNAEVGTNPNGGIDWAAVRAENGHAEPYNVRYFEIGNEMQQAYNADGTGSQGYWTTSVSGGSEKAYTEGGTAIFTKQYAVCEEDWNHVASQSDGSANLIRYMRYANVNPKVLDAQGELVDDPSFIAVDKDSVSVYVGSTQWTIVDSLADSTGSDQHVVVDYSTGALQFGDGRHGAIPAAGQQIYVSYSVERDGFIDISRAIKETTDVINEKEGKKLEANVYTSYESSGFISRMSSLGAEQWYDGMTIHPYSGTVTGSTAEVFYDNAMKLAEDSGIQKVKNYVAQLPEGKVPVISEYGIFRNTETQLRSQTHALYIAKTLMEYVKLGSPYIQKHCLVDWYSSGADALGPTQQAVIQAIAKDGASTATGEGTFAFFATPSAHVFKMLNSRFGDRIVASEFDQMPVMSNGVKKLSSLVSVDAVGNIYLALLNLDRENDLDIQIDIQGTDITGRTVQVQTLASESIVDENTLDDPDKVCVENSSFTASGEDTYTLPKHSFTILKVVRENPFTDVKENAYYYTPVLWASNEGITQGRTETEFRPKEDCTRAQVVTFLWRAAGSPEPQSDTDGFPDVDPVKHKHFYKAIQWAAEQNITKGYPDGTFGPDRAVTRAEYVTFQYRAAGSPNVLNQDNPFADVNKKAHKNFIKAILWAYENGITKGKDETHFQPDINTSRANVVTFLYRSAAENK